MRRTRVVVAATGAVIASAGVAEFPWERAIGFMFKRRVAPGDGMFFANCRAVHTFFVLTPIDVVFLDDAHGIVDIRTRVAPFRAAIVCDRATAVLELGGGAAASAGLTVGERLSLQ